MTVAQESFTIAFFHNLLHRRLTDRSIFTLLLLPTLTLTFLLSYILVASLQRIADEHPRRFLARILFQEIVNQTKEQPNWTPSIDGTPPVQMTAEEAERSNYATLL